MIVLEKKPCNWEKLSYPRLCALVAKKPTKLSQAMHNAGYAATGQPFSYTALDVAKTADAIAAMRSLGFRGYSLTIPHKESVIELLDDVSEEVSRIGACNTVVNDGEKLTGYNTDCYGIEQAFAEANESLKGRRVLLLGAGGAARAVVYVLKSQSAAEVIIANRSDERSKQLAEEFKTSFLPYSELPSFAIGSGDVIIQSTPLGSVLDTSTSTNYPFDVSACVAGVTVFDLVTKDTPLTVQAKAQGAKVITGPRMLLHQALAQFELFTEQQAPQAEMEKALYSELGLPSVN